MIYPHWIYLAIKRNEVLILAATQTSLENMLREKGQSQGAIYCMIDSIYMNCPEGKCIETESRLPVGLGGLGRNGESLLITHWGFGGEENVLKLIGVMIAQFVYRLETIEKHTFNG